MSETIPYHIPVLLKESIEGLQIHPNGIYADVTFGGGGHSKEILSHLNQDGHLFGFDQDADAEQNIPNNPKFTFVRSNFRYLRNFLQYYKHSQIDGVLADLGVSSHHLDDSTRGFAFRLDGELDMRMNKRAAYTAAYVVNNYSEEQLEEVFRNYGEIKQSKRLAYLLVKARQHKTVNTTGDFLEILKPIIPREREKKELAKIFQALRIEVNEEMEALKEMLKATSKVIKPGGRLAVITYHSIEDRIVKNFIRSGDFDAKEDNSWNFSVNAAPFQAVNRKVIIPTDNEIELNPRARSAKLRIAEKL